MKSSSRDSPAGRPCTRFSTSAAVAAAGSGRVKNSDLATGSDPAHRRYRRRLVRRPADNRSLEARPDVLTFTSDPQAADLEVIGPVRVRLYVRAPVAYIDLHARLCDVTPSGQSINISDGIVRLTDASVDTPHVVEFDLWPVRTRSGAATGSGCRSQVALILATDATSAPQNRSPIANAYRQATAHYSTVPSTPPQCGYPCTADLKCRLPSGIHLMIYPISRAARTSAGSVRICRHPLLLLQPHQDPPWA
jgi:hypothetical protein